MKRALFYTFKNNSVEEVYCKFFLFCLNHVPVIMLFSMDMLGLVFRKFHTAWLHVPNRSIMTFNVFFKSFSDAIIV